jgi:hypothetical protein
MSSWPVLFAVALAMWLVLRGPARKKPSWVQRACRVATAFFAYAGFLYLLKWDPFWKLLSVDLYNRNRIEGFLILLSTLIWLIATLRALLSGSRFAPPHTGFDGLQNRAPRQEKLWPFVKDVAIFYYLFTRK